MFCLLMLFLLCLWQVLILELTKEYIPSYIQINMEGEEDCVRLWHAATTPGCKKIHQWTFSATSIKSVRSVLKPITDARADVSIL